MTPRPIRNTQFLTQHDWPEDVYIQGGGCGVVFCGNGPSYLTAFVEAFPEGTFLRGEGATVPAAEDDCWLKYLAMKTCSGPNGEHGPYEARAYTNGSGFCVHCGTWFPNVLKRRKSD